jgi:methyltransferase (TIGR00027 family)
MRFASLTAEAVCLARALEHRRPPGERLVDDPLARRFLRLPARGVVRGASLGGGVATAVEDHLQPGLVAAIAARHGWIDARLLRDLPRVAQVLVLGAGYDSRAWRLAHEGQPWVEVDHPATQRRKARRAHRLGLPPVERVPADFTLETLDDILARAPLEAGAPTAIVWEGVTMYLERAVIRQVLEGLRRWAGPGSHLLLDLWAPARGALRAVEGAGRLGLAVVGEPVRTAVEPVRISALLAEGGWAVEAREDVDRVARLHGGRRAFPPLQVVDAIPAR